MSMPDTYTKHAKVRAQQRCIPPLIDEWLDRFGEEEYDGRGGIRKYFSRRSIRSMQREFGREPVRRMHDYFDAYKVEDSRGGATVTIGHRDKRLKRK